MKKCILILTCVLGAFEMSGQTEGPDLYNPDANGDGLVTVEDLVSLLGVYGLPFESQLCPCGGCDAVPNWEFASHGDTLTAAQVAANLFVLAPDSIYLQAHISPYGEGYFPFLGDTVLHYEPRTLSRAWEWDRTRTVAPARMLFTNELPVQSSYSSLWLSFMENMYNSSGYDNYFVDNYNASAMPNGGFLLQDGEEVIDFEIDDVCEEIGNDEFWEILGGTLFIQIAEHTYMNLEMGPSHLTPTHLDPDNAQWVFSYPLDWVILSAAPIGDIFTQE